MVAFERRTRRCDGIETYAAYFAAWLTGRKWYNLGFIVMYGMYDGGKWLNRCGFHRRNRSSAAQEGFEECEGHIVIWVDTCEENWVYLQDKVAAPSIFLVFYIIFIWMVYVI